MMSKTELRDGIIALLRQSGLTFDDQVKAISEARTAIQPRLSETDWRAKSKPIPKPGERKKSTEAER